MGRFIGVTEVEEGDEVQLTVVYDDDAVADIIGRVRLIGLELWVGTVSIDKLPTAQWVRSYAIELRHRDEKHGYYLAPHKESWSQEVYLWKYDSSWNIVKSTLDGDFVAGGSHEPSFRRRFIGTELPELEEGAE